MRGDDRVAAYPVRYAVDKPDRFTRFGLVLRVLVLLTLGAFGVSLAAIFFVVCLSLPAVAGGLLADRGTRGYLATDAPRILRVLRWLAAIYGWLGWATDALPSRSPVDTIRVDVEIGSTTTPRAALARMLLGVPSMLALTLLAFVAAIVWLWAALSVLLTERIGDGPYHFLVGMQRWGVRLLAYQAALVDDYPPFSLAATISPGRLDITSSSSSW
jgi:hypothetical protein